LKGGEAIYNAEALRAVLDGQVGPFRDVALLNAAATLLVAGKAETLEDAAKIAAKSIDHGAARARLDKLVAVSSAQ
jgi:anthranilate phosphoribosyltransferase